MVPTNEQPWLPGYKIKDCHGIDDISAMLPTNKTTMVYLINVVMV